MIPLGCGRDLLPRPDQHADHRPPAVVYVSYRQTIAAYPHGGGSYTVAKENLGTNAGLIAAAALMLDYVLVVAVGISAGVGALVSALPVAPALHLAALPGDAGVHHACEPPRGPGVGPGLPGTDLLVHRVTLAGRDRPGGLSSRSSPADASDAREDAHRSGHRPEAAASFWILMRAFASGCTAMTGVEAVSNGVGAFREPSVPHAQADLDGHHRPCSRSDARGDRLPLPWPMGSGRPRPGVSPVTRVSSRSWWRRSSGEGCVLLSDDRLDVLVVLALSANTGLRTSPGSAGWWRRTASCPTASRTGGVGWSTRRGSSCSRCSRPDS